MAACAAMAFWITSVSSETPSPLAPSSRRLTTSREEAGLEDLKRPAGRGNRRSRVASEERLDPRHSANVQEMEAVEKVFTT